MAPLTCPLLIDRAADLDTLRALIARADGGAGQAVLVSGEAGIGKSRLIAEAKAYAAGQGLLVFQGSCFPSDVAVPYAPLLDLLRPLLAEARLAEALAPLAPVLFRAFPDLALRAAGSPARYTRPPLPPADPEQEKRQLFAALAAFFTAPAAGARPAPPVLLIVEDLHWSDDTSLEFLHYLARRCPAHGLLLLLSYRSEEVRPGLRHFLAQFDRERLGRELVLAHLSKDGVAAMLGAMLDLPAPGRTDLLEPIYALTEGNPFFVEEILGALLAAGDIVYEGGRWRHKPLAELHIPRSVRDAVQARLEQLTTGARRVVTLAAVAGRRFDFALLHEVMHNGAEQLLQALKELVAAQLVVEESADHFAFRHALTREAISADLLARERQALHRTIATALERLHASALDAVLPDLAYHFYWAGAWSQAWEYGQRAVEQGRRLYAPQAIVEQATRALDAAHFGAFTPAPTLYRYRGQAHEALGEFEPARRDYETALMLARAAAERAGEWQALSALGALWAARDYSQAGRYYTDALALARRLDDPLTLARSLNQLGNWHVNLEQPVAAREYQREALALFAAAGDAQGLAETADLLGMTTLLAGDLVQGAAYLQQAVARFAQTGDRVRLASSLTTLAATAGIYETETLVPAPLPFADGVAYAERGLGIARDTGERPAEIFALLTLAQLAGPRGEYGRALPAARAGLALAQEIQHGEWRVHGYWVLGALYLDLLALAEATRELQQACALAREVGSANWLRIGAGFLAPAYVQQRQLDRAAEVLAAAQETDAPMQTIGQRLVWRARAALALAQGDADRALDLADRLLASAENRGAGAVIPQLAVLRGQALAALNRGGEATRALESGLEAAEAQGLRPLAWRAAAALGRLYRAQRRHRDAERAFARARGVIAALAAAVPDAALAGGFAAGALSRLPQSRPPTPRQVARQESGGLTERERAVAALIAAGQGNQEIADRLVVGLRTVETHVTSILTKLGLSSRLQIAVWARDHHLTPE